MILPSILHPLPSRQAFALPTKITPPASPHSRSVIVVRSDGSFGFFLSAEAGCAPPRTTNARTRNSVGFHRRVMASSLFRSPVPTAVTSIARNSLARIRELLNLQPRRGWRIPQLRSARPSRLAHPWAFLRIRSCAARPTPAPSVPARPARARLNPPFFLDSHFASRLLNSHYVSRCAPWLRSAAASHPG
jgi:hypothetical protein